MEISFGVIFSIIIIIAIVGIGTYIIIHFMRTSDCIKVGMFYQSLQDEVDKAWKSDFYQGTFEGKLNSGVESVCFGSMMENSNDEKFEKIRMYASRDSNTFLYPATSCSGGSSDYKLENVNLGEFSCFNVVNGKVNINLVMDSSENLVRIVK